MTDKTSNLYVPVHQVAKRNDESSLMQLKEEYRTYEALRREHDAQIVNMAQEAGIRIPPDQWSQLLYGDTAHKSHMQSIIDRVRNSVHIAQRLNVLSLILLCYLELTFTVFL